MLHNRLLPVMVAALLSVGGAAQACSVVPGYKVPTTMELVNQADSIILARVGAPIAGRSDGVVGYLTLQPELLVAGETMPPISEIYGNLGSKGWSATPSNPNELAQANPDAFRGGCNRYTFDEEMLLLLFVDRRSTRSWEIISAPFARTLEDVPDANALWVRAVRFYSTLRGLRRSERDLLMQAERTRLLASGDPHDALLAADILHQMRGGRTQNFD